jgi:signal transduction histidine kinase
VTQQAHELQTLIDDGFTGLQNLISGLHPPQLDDFGLMAALRWYAREVRERYNLSVDLSNRGDEPDLPVDLRVVLYRIVQEALTNVIRHARTDQARIDISFDPRNVTIRIDDNGCGFDVNSMLNKPGYPCWGLLGMIERAALVGGTCQITSEDGAGTLVEVVIPITQGEVHG